MKNVLKNIVGAVAPTLGTALGGPMGGMAANMIADVLGVPNNPKSIEKAIAEATPEQMLELKKAEQAFEVQMKELDVDIFKLETQDAQDARKNFSKDWTARIMGIATVVDYQVILYLVTLELHTLLKTNGTSSSLYSRSWISYSSSNRSWLVYL